MTLVKDIRKTVTDTTPVYAAVGVTDLAVERLRDARTRAAAVRKDLDVSAMQDRAVKRFEKVTEQVQQIPAQVRSQTVEVAGKARETYTGLAVRGEKLVKRVRSQKSTKDLFAQAGSTVSLGKGAVTTVRKVAHDTQRAAIVTLAPATTPTVIEGTGTHGKKSTASAERATRSVAAGARKTTTTAKTVTPKVGD
jgi:tartrate dehydratase beta subunit/fumarate hydratase class I family protein